VKCMVKQWRELAEGGREKLRRLFLHTRHKVTRGRAWRFCRKTRGKTPAGTVNKKAPVSEPQRLSAPLGASAGNAETVKRVQTCAISTNVARVCSVAIVFAIAIHSRASCRYRAAGDSLSGIAELPHTEQLRPQ
jgi:hypothetical protein